jgi:hypothetical protein
VSAERCERDVIALLGELTERRLIRLESDAGDAALS